MPADDDDVEDTAPIAQMVNRHGGPGCELMFEAFGLRIRIWIYDASMLKAVIERLPPHWRAAEAGDGAVSRTFRIEHTDCFPEKRSPAGVWLTSDDKMLAWAPTNDLILDAVESQLQQYVAEYAEPFLFVHAGVVRWRGVTIILPGASYSGKSTLVAALVDAGATYYSDEYAVLNHDGQVMPYGRRLSLRDGPLGPAGRLNLSRNGPRPEDARHPAPIDLVLFSTYRQGANWSHEPLDHLMALMALCEHTVAIQRRPADTFAILGKVAKSAHVYRGVRGDLESVVRWVDDMVTKLHPANQG